MPTVAILNQHGEDVGQIELSAEVFDVPVREHLLYDSVRMYLANRRNANPRTRNRAAVSGGGKKPYKQKGTGQARQGSTRAPHWRGGGVVFGPNGRKYTIQLNRKARRAAMRSALSLRFQQKELLVVKELALEAPKTKLFVKMADKLGAARALFVTGDKDEALVRSSRNIEGLKVTSMSSLCVYEVLKYPRLVLTLPAIEQIEARLKG